MWIEIVAAGKTIGAVNSECCDLIRVDANDPRGAESGALIRCVATGEQEVFKSKISYLRLIEAITQSEAQGLKQIAEIVADANEAKDEAARPKLIIPGR